MNELEKNLDKIKESLNSDLKKINYYAKLAELKTLQEQSQKSDFWADSAKATAHAQKQSKLENEIHSWSEALNSITEIEELVGLKDESLSDDLKKQLNELEARLSVLKKDLKFNNKYDAFDAIISIYSGAGGTDAQDWAGMLLRMYTRWAEKNNLKVNLINESTGEEAGIKSADLEVSGKNAYGLLRSEHGVHRLVRLSPFNADAKRQTSFAKVDVLPKIATPEDVPIEDSELKIDVFRAGGHGGQSVNTTDSAVRITHLPTGITVSIQNERSQIQNKETAMTILRSKLAHLQEEQHQSSLRDLKGPNQSAEWGNQIRNYVMHPYSMVKDLRSGHETSQVNNVLDGDLNDFIDAYLEDNALEKNA